MKEANTKTTPKKEIIKDNKIIKWTSFPPDSKVTFNFNSITPIGKRLDCLKTFPVFMT
jgi:hypothetical protein